MFYFSEGKIFHVKACFSTQKPIKISSKVFKTVEKLNLFVIKESDEVLFLSSRWIKLFQQTKFKLEGIEPFIKQSTPLLRILLLINVPIHCEKSLLCQKPQLSSRSLNPVNSSYIVSLKRKSISIDINWQEEICGDWNLWKI